MEKSSFENLPETGSKKEYTLEDLEKAREELRFWEEKFANARGNNPNKFRSQIKDAGRNVRWIKEALKTSGIIEKSDTEKMAATLDKLYPNAKSKRVVTYEGERYHIRYFPLDKSRSGKTVHEWGHEWRLVEETPKKVVTDIPQGDHQDNPPETL